MLAKLYPKTLAASLALLLASGAIGASATGQQPAADLGRDTSGQEATVTLVLKLRHTRQLETFIRQTVTPGSPNYHRFLDTRTFARRFGADLRDIRRIQAYLARRGLRSQAMANRMAIHVHGPLDQIGAVFGTRIDRYRSTSGRLFHRPTARLVMPAPLAGSVLATAGLSNERQYLSHRIGLPRALAGAPATVANAAAPAASAQSTLTLRNAATTINPTATGIPGQYTVGDAADFYHVNPLYRRGITGKGSTIGIVTLSNFHPSDARAYWQAIGLRTPRNRVHRVAVDGGAPIDADSGETALDVEQAGGLAPEAQIIVYHAPNGGSGFLDAFIRAVSDNCADSISTSWGLPELYNFASFSAVGASVDDTSDAGDLEAFHQVLMEAAAQGQSVFAATGDSGAYDTVRGLGHGVEPFTFTAPLSVDSPASDPYITAAGGTTVPYTFSFGGGPRESIRREQVWGWDYLQAYFDTNIGKGAVDLFSVGGGGGVSVYWRRPFYQAFTDGIRRSEPHQQLALNDVDGPFVLSRLPGRFPGRNIPDLSLNADPQTGYLLYSTTDGGLVSGQGGTSFVAPQLNGISALLTQSTGHRVGFWNPQIYFLQKVFGYGRWGAFRSVPDGDNWFYHGKPHYSPAMGLGTLDVANLDRFLRSGF